MSEPVTLDEIQAAIDAGQLWVRLKSKLDAFYRRSTIEQASDKGVNQPSQLIRYTLRWTDKNWREAEWVICPVDPNLSDFHIHGLIASMT